jgi:phage terminase small subunit
MDAEIQPIELTPKQKRFCEEYLIDLNATQAAIRAGYSEDSAASIGHENLRKPEIEKTIQELQIARSKRTEITADYVLNTVRDTVERCRQAVPVMEWDPVEKVMVPTGEWKFEYPGVLKGCELLGKNLKLWTEKTESTQKIMATVEVSHPDIDDRIKQIEDEE